jgi:hypothetical protein
VVLFAAYWTGSRTSQLAIVAVLVSYGLIRWLPALARRLPNRRATGPAETAESAGTAGTGTRTTWTAWTARWAVAVPVVAGLVLTVAAPLLTRDPAAFSERGRIWAALLDRWSQAPLLGFGPGYFDNQPDLADALGGQFSHAHNVLVQLLVVGGLLATVLFGVLLYLVWRRSMALLAAGLPAAGLFLVAFAQVSWLEASHLPTTLAGYVGWLPLIIIARLGADRADRPSTDPAPADRPQKMMVSRR